MRHGEKSAENGYCEHGVYVGGCGIDWMCGYCEDGISAAELAEARRAQDHTAALELDRVWELQGSAEFAGDSDGARLSREALRAYVTGRVARSLAELDEVTA